MVTQYATKEGILVGARPFYGVLLAGDAGRPDPQNPYVEQFLRASEPPAHDKWAFTDDLREMYERGAKARLDDFLNTKLNEALRKILRVPARDESDGPPELKKLLNLGGPSDGPKEALAVLRNVQPEFKGDRWNVKADVLIKLRDKPLEIEPYVAMNVESGRPLRVSWQKLELIPHENVRQTADQKRFVADGRATRFTFKGITEPADVPVDPSRCTARIALILEEP